MEKNKFGVNNNHFGLYITAFSLGVGILFLLFIKQSLLWQGIITNVGAGLIITSLFAFWIDKLNNINQRKKTKEKQQILLRHLEYCLHYICDLHIRTFNLVKKYIKEKKVSEDYLKKINSVNNIEDSIVLIRNIITNLLLNLSPPESQEVRDLKKWFENLLQKNNKKLEKILDSVIDFNTYSLYVNEIISSEDLQIIEDLYMPLQDSVDFYLENYYHDDLLNIIGEIQQRFEFKRLPTLEKLKENLNTDESRHKE